MSVEGVFSITLGQMGVGKSYTRVHAIVSQMLLDPQLKICTNIDLNFDAIAEYASRVHKMEPDVVRSRLELIPQDVARKWRLQSSGPWDYFSGRDTQGMHLILDESHEMVSRHHHKTHVAKWLEFIRTIRHRGATVEFLTQTDADFPEPLKKVCAKRFYVTDGSAWRDPITTIPLGDWQQLWCRWGNRPYIPWIMRTEKVLLDNKWISNDVAWYRREPWVFKLYNSHQETADGESGERRKDPHEIYGDWGILRWFLRRNWTRLVFNRNAWIMAVLLLFASGNGTPIIKAFTTEGQRIMTASIPKADATYLKKDRGKQTKKVVQKMNLDQMSPQQQLEIIKPEYQRLLSAQVNHSGEVAAITMERDRVQRLYLEALSTLDAYYKEADKSSKLKMLTPGSIVMESGEEIFTGDVILDGVYKGERLVSINYQRRRAEFASGLILRMVSDPMPLRNLRMQAERVLAGETVESTPDPQASFQADLRASEPEPGTAGVSDGDREENHGISRGDAAGVVPALPQ